MTALTFDIRGNLTPYQPIEVTVELFRETFVESFEADSTRHALWIGFEKFVADFREQISESFQLWVDGSFVTTRSNPKDIDVVVFVDYRVYEEKEKLINARFRTTGARQHYKIIDAYSVKVFPEGHAKRFLTQSDQAYWQNWFGRAPRRKTESRFPKGFIQLKL